MRGMRQAAMALWLVACLGGAPMRAIAYDDLPFAMSCDVADSMMFVWHSQEIAHLEFVYVPEDLQMYLNGEPLCPCTPDIDGRPPANIKMDVLASRYHEHMASWCEAGRRADDARAKLIWDVAELLAANAQLRKPDWLLWLLVLGKCRESPIADTVAGVIVVGGRPWYRFAGVPHVKKGYLAGERPTLGCIRLPLRECYLKSAERYCRLLVSRRRYSCVFAVCAGGGEMSVSGKGRIEAVRNQLAAIARSGQYVSGPLAEEYLK